MSNETAINEGIPILIEIINNKNHQIIVTPNVHQWILTKNNDFQKLKILEVKISKNEDVMLDFLKEYTNWGTTYYLYLYDENQYVLFSNIYKKYFYESGLKLIRYLRLVNTIKAKDGPNQNQFKVEQKIFKINTKRDKKENKLKEPLVIIELLENNKVKVKNKNNKTEIIHVKELKQPVSVTDSLST